MRTTGTVLATACGLALLAAFAAMRPGASAQQGAMQQRAARQPAGATQTLHVVSRLTVVDVTAIDANGQPVQGLKSSNFTLYEDGKPEPIRNFEEVRSHPAQPPPPLPPNVYTDLQPPPPSSAVNIVLLDLLNEAPMDDTNPGAVSGSVQMQHYVKVAAIQAVQTMPTGTQVAVLTMTDDLRTVQSFTSNRALLTAAINAVPYDTVSLAGPRGGQCQEMDNRNNSVLEALDVIAHDTAPIYGRKNLIWFTVGIPQITIPSDRPGCLPDYSRSLSDTYALLTAAQVSIYPVDARGGGRLGAAQLSEQMVAEATGGVAYWGSNNMASPVLSAINNGANYYSIAYIPPNTRHDGQYHKIEVKVNRPGVNLTYRQGYYDDDTSKMKMPPGLTLSTSPPAVVNNDMRAPMSRGLATSSDVLFNVAVLPSLPPRTADAPVLGTLDPRLKGRPLTRYGFQYSVPIQQIVFQNGTNGAHQDKLDFDLAVYDSGDRLLTGLSQTVTLTLTDASYRQMVANKEAVKLFQRIDLPPGQLFIRVGVLDHNSGKDGTLNLPLTVGRK